MGTENVTAYRITAEDATARAWMSVQRNASGALERIMSLVPGFATALSAAGMVSFTKDALDAADRLNDLSKSTNISVESLAGLKLAAKQSGGDLDSIAASINKLSVEMGKSPAKFMALGISAKDPLEAFKQLADIFNAIEDPQQRAAVAATALGRSWAGAAPLLAEGSKKIGEMVEAGTKASGMTRELAQKSDELNDKWVLLWGSGGMVNAVLARMIDPLTSITNQMIAAKNASSGFFDAVSKFSMLSAQSPDKQIAAIDAELASLRKTAGTEEDWGGPNRFFDNFDDNTQARIALLESQRKTLFELAKLQPPDTSGSAGASDAGTLPAPTHAIPNIRNKVDAFLDPEAKAKANEMHQLWRLIIDDEDRWQKMVEDHIKTVHRLEDAEFAASVAQLEQQSKEELANQANFVAMQQRSLEEGRLTAESLRDPVELENVGYKERLADLNIYLSSVQATNARAMLARQSLETRHQQTLLQIERNKNEAQRSMEIGTWQAAGDLLQAFAGKSREAAIAAIAINKGLAIAQTIQNTAGAAMRAMFELGPIAGPPAVAWIEALGAAQIGLIGATGLVDVSQVGSGGATLGSPANPVNITGGISGAGTSTSTPAPMQTVIVRFEGNDDTKISGKQMRAFVKQLEEATRNGSRIVIG